MQPRRLYLDNAATSWPKPEAVYAAVDRYRRKLGAPAGRGGYAEAIEVERLVASCRSRLARLLGVSEPRRIIFTSGGTDSLNLALHGLLKRGDRVVTTAAEHNSVLRPLRRLQQRQGVQVTVVPCDRLGYVDPSDIRQACGDGARLVVLTHASNVTGALQPAADVGRIAHEAGALFLLDAAQSLGHTPARAAELGADLVAAPGHKGLLGPLGVGVLYVSPAAEKLLQSQRQGGTGTQSDQDEHPEQLPYKYESGNLNVPGILGLEAALRFLEERTVEAIGLHEHELTSRLLAALGGMPGVTVYGPSAAQPRVGVVSVNLAGYDPQEASVALDAVYRIQARAGLHCAPLVHRVLGTAHGTLRFSFGPFNTSQDVDTLVQALAEMAPAAPASI